jgi:hypothetical protein
VVALQLQWAAAGRWASLQAATPLLLPLLLLLLPLPLPLLLLLPSCHPKVHPSLHQQAVGAALVAAPSHACGRPQRRVLLLPN